ncbi:MAG: hypothetical protein AUI89_05655 [Gemmatimonadetes bacterium 13_1_40CM_3_65_8]|nr:MAG: hypothetical protein AUI89_05655 [Gemmatimonadetes bacterium 13_1_40CM_3_65_8]
MKSLLPSGLAAALLSGCGKGTAPPPTFLISYVVAGTPRVTFDSVVYENAQGQIVKVIAPANDWGISFPMPAYGYVQGTAWAVATAANETASLKVRWTLTGVRTDSDSSTATTTAPNRFTLQIVRRQIF